MKNRIYHNLMQYLKNKQNLKTHIQIYGSFKMLFIIDDHFNHVYNDKWERNVNSTFKRKTNNSLA